MELVTWWSNRDVVPAAVMTDCPCDLFGTMGIRDHAGAPRRPVFDRWRAARELPVR